MTNISTILLCCSSLLNSTSQQHLLLIIEALLSMNGRITLLGISRWTEKGGSYRTLQRFAANVLDWQALNWALFRHFILGSEDVILIAGDTTTVTKAGKKTYGLGRYFSSIHNRAVSGLSFLCLSFVSVKKRSAFPMVVEQWVKSTTAKKEHTPPKEKRGRGRPKGSRNKNQNKQLSESTRWIQGHLKALLERVKGTLKPVYFLYDNALGNLDGIVLCESLGLHLISKLKCNSALWFPYEGEYSGRGAPRIYGDKINYRDLPPEHLKHVETSEGIETNIYQLTVRHKRFPQSINVVIIQKTRIETQKVAQVILFSTNL
ncbi:MAG: transposase, partial [Pontimonas sp.]